jgi:hypothetical protein
MNALSVGLPAGRSLTSPFRYARWSSTREMNLGLLSTRILAGAVSHRLGWRLHHTNDRVGLQALVCLHYQTSPGLGIHH